MRVPLIALITAIFSALLPAGQAAAYTVSPTVLGTCWRETHSGPVSSDVAVDSKCYSETWVIDASNGALYLCVANTIQQTVNGQQTIALSGTANCSVIFAPTISGTMYSGAYSTNPALTNLGVPTGATQLGGLFYWTARSDAWDTSFCVDVTTVGKLCIAVTLQP
jgi:hypothetical protein